MADTVVKLAVTQGVRLDLRGDNHLPALLEEREQVKADIKALQERLGEIEAEAKDKIGDARETILDGWRITQKQVERAEYTVKASTLHRIVFTRTGRKPRPDIQT